MNRAKRVPCIVRHTNLSAALMKVVHKASLYPPGWRDVRASLWGDGDLGHLTDEIGEGVEGAIGDG